MVSAQSFQSDDYASNRVLVDSIQANKFFTRDKSIKMVRQDDDEADDVGRLTHDGARGPTFRAFKRDFLAVARGRFAKDDRFSFHEAYLRVDEGGTDARAPALPNQASGTGPIGKLRPVVWLLCSGSLTRILCRSWCLVTSGVCWLWSSL